MWSSIIGISAYMLAPKIIGKLREQKIEIVHAIPGRLRLRNTSWKNDQIALLIEREMRKHPLVKSANASPITGTLLIEFTTLYLEQAQLDEIFHIATNSTIEGFAKADDKAITIIGKTFNNVNGNVKKVTNGYVSVDSMMIAFFIFRAIKTYSTNPAFATSLLYWVYTMLKNNDSNGGGEY